MGMGRFLRGIREALTGKAVIHVRPRVWVGYDAESEERWRKRFGYSRRLPDVAAFCAALDPAVLAADEAGAETVVKLSYAWGSPSALGRRAGSSIFQAVALICEVTVWSRVEKKVVARRVFSGVLPPDSVLSTPRQCTDEVLSEMPPVAEVAAFLQRLRVG